MVLLCHRLFALYSICFIIADARRRLPVDYDLSSPHAHDFIEQEEDELIVNVTRRLDATSDRRVRSLPGLSERRLRVVSFLMFLNS
jgi:hypothetical protein